MGSVHQRRVERIGQMDSQRAGARIPADVALELDAKRAIDQGTRLAATL